MDVYDEVLFREQSGQGGNIGIITLNRPKVLNSLNQNMVLAMHKQLRAWQTNDAIKAVIITAAEGRAFCAGGDLRFTYDRYLKDVAHVSDFFRDEYALNRCIFHYPKPYIAFLDGITMGGGVGISIHGSHRVATNRLVFAMPETSIGFYPDVGGTFFLPRLPGSIGVYLALTGARVGLSDCLRLGLVNHAVKQEDLADIITAIAEQDFKEHAKKAVTEVLHTFATDAPSGELLEDQAILNICFSGDTLEEIISVLHASTDAICKDALTLLEKKSPTSLKVTLQALQSGKDLDFDHAMQQEFRLTTHFLRNHDFLEGIRALIIEKDNQPKWQPATLNEVTNEQVEAYFMPIEKELAIESN